MSKSLYKYCGVLSIYIGIRASNIKVEINNCLAINKKGQKVGQKVQLNVLFGQKK